MRNTNKAFTLVELIVVITILAILATIAFISLSGYTSDAKESKVRADVRTLVSAIETGLANGDFTLKDLGSTPIAANTAADATNTVNNGEFVLPAAADQGAYNVSNIDFTVLGQNGDDFKFKDSAGVERDYIFAYVASGSYIKYQVAGQYTNEAGDEKAVVSGNYINMGGAEDATGLITPNGNATEVVKDATLANELY